MTALFFNIPCGCLDRCFWGLFIRPESKHEGNAPTLLREEPEKLFAVFPHNGKNLSTLWKTRISGCFQGFKGSSPGLLSGARGAPCEP